MKSITIADQPWLSMRRTISITVDGIRYRLFRASVTVAVIVVAVAFLMNILAESLIKRSVASNTRERIDTSRVIYNWSAKLSSPGSQESIIIEVAKCSPGSDLYRETQRFAAMSDEEMAAFHTHTQKLVFVFDFFNSLDYAKRRAMIHTASGLDILNRLRNPENMEQFKLALTRIRSVHFDMDFDELDELLAKGPEVRKQLSGIISARRQAIAQINQTLKGKSILEKLAGAQGAFGDTVRQAGFIFDAEDTAPLVADQAQRLLDILTLEESMEERPARQLIAQQANILPADVNVMLMWKYLDGKRFADRYLEKMQESGLNTAGLDADRLVDLAQSRKENAALLRAERLTHDAGKGFLGLGERLGWLLFVSMLVCGIGITNAMMMAVTERFNEIATLKCLGALDGFIMIMFVLESCFMGVVGGIIGAILGGVIGLGRMLAAFGVNFLGAIPVADIFLGMLMSVLLGTILAALAAVIPSFKAARLAPMEAMRVE
jgi:hypothetical protein